MCIRYIYWRRDDHRRSMHVTITRAVGQQCPHPTDSSSSSSSEPGNMRHHHQRCRRVWIAAWSFSAGALLTGMLCFLGVYGSPVAHTDGLGKTRGGSTTTGLRFSGEGGACSSYDVGQEEVSGLEFCPQLSPLLPLLLENKRRLLRLALDAVDGKPRYRSTVGG